MRTEDQRVECTLKASFITKKKSAPPSSSYLPAFLTKPTSASTAWQISQRKQSGCQLLFMALMTRPMINSPEGRTQKQGRILLLFKIQNKSTGLVWSFGKNKQRSTGKVSNSQVVKKGGDFFRKSLLQNEIKCRCPSRLRFGRLPHSVFRNTNDNVSFNTTDI